MLDLILYLFIYSFIGWCIEVIVIAISEHRFANRGILNLPLCLSYGIIMDLLIILTRERTDHGFIMFGICLVVISAAEFLAGFLAKRLFKRQLWDYMNLSLFGGQWESLLISLLLSFSFFTFLKIIHPFIYTLIHLIPRALRHSISIGMIVILVLDMVTVIPAFSETKNRIGRFIYHRIRRRLDKAYPDKEGTARETQETQEAQETQGQPEDGTIRAGEAGTGAAAASQAVFAQGVCFEKLVWVFMLYGLVGNLVETVVVWYQTGIWMRRASLVFIPVSIVWGFGGVLFMIMLSHLALKEDRYIFVGGFLLGGSFEYMCSVITETFWGTKFWDYSTMPFNIDGRTNLLFCLLWGVVAMLWIKVIYPKFSAVIEGIPAVIGKAVTFVMVALLILDMILTGAVMLRASRRRTDPAPHNFLEEYIDQNYPDAVVKRHWRNIRFDGKLLQVDEEAPSSRAPLKE